MARSTYVYVVVDALSRPLGPLAAFTVKYELCAWLRRNCSDGEAREEWRVWRVRDGGFRPEPKEVSIQDLLDGGK